MARDFQALGEEQKGFHSTQWDRGCGGGDHWVLSGTERVPSPLGEQGLGGYETRGGGRVMPSFLCWSVRGLHSPACRAGRKPGSWQSGQ